MAGEIGWHVDGQGRRFRVMKLGPGVYVDDAEALHLDLTELLAAHGFADTPENRATLTATAREMFSRLGADVDTTDA